METTTTDRRDAASRDGAIGTLVSPPRSRQHPRPRRRRTRPTGAVPALIKVRRPRPRRAPSTRVVAVADVALAAASRSRSLSLHTRPPRLPCSRPRVCWAAPILQSHFCANSNRKFTADEASKPLSNYISLAAGPPSPQGGNPILLKLRVAVGAKRP